MNETIKTEQKSRHLTTIVYLWFLILTIAVAALITAVFLRGAIDRERQVEKNKLALVEAGYQLENASDYLTAEVRNFVVTADAQHLQSYWHEVDVSQNRDKAVERLKQLSADAKEIDLLIQSKRSSDALIQTEVHGMKLLLDAYKVPEASTHPVVRAYKLSATDQALPPDKKILLAQKMMFNQQYYLDKEKIMAPIEKFRQLIKTRLTKEAALAQAKTNHLSTALLGILILLAISILILIWVRVFVFPVPPRDKSE